MASSRFTAFDPLASAISRARSCTRVIECGPLSISIDSTRLRPRMRRGQSCSWSCTFTWAMASALSTQRAMSPFS